MDEKVDEAGTALKTAHTLPGKNLVLPPPIRYNGQRLTCELTVYPDMYADNLMFSTATTQQPQLQTST